MELFLQNPEQHPLAVCFREKIGDSVDLSLGDEPTSVAWIPANRFDLPDQHALSEKRCDGPWRGHHRRAVQVSRHPKARTGRSVPAAELQPGSEPVAAAGFADVPELRRRFASAEKEVTV